MNARDALLDAWHLGHEPAPKFVVLTIASFDELEAYRAGLSERGGLTAEALAAIRDRKEHLGKWKVIK